MVDNDMDMECEDCPKSDEEFPTPPASCVSTATSVHNTTAVYANSNQLIWDQWMCMLASTLTPPQWQAYWRAYASLFGVNALPTHLLSFFGDILSQNSTMEEDEVEQMPTEQSCSIQKVG
uniref:Uncharacterized protein n=1 Tax=Ditylenchus dipsaci TaxID=166011 RepID=A0A915DUZ6_9BILA